MSSLTSANAVLLLSITSLYNAPQQIQGFAADDVFDLPAVRSAETFMGVDGVLSGGFVYAQIPQTITLQADSLSNLIFENWWNFMQENANPYIASGSITLNSVGRKYTMTRGFLTSYSPAPPARRILQPRRYEITWQTIVGAPSNSPPSS